MSKYSPIGFFLANSQNNTEVLTFQELENKLGFKLPDSATVHREWWANETSPKTRHTHCKEWINAGWKVENVNLGVDVTFSKLN